MATEGRKVEGIIHHRVVYSEGTQPVFEAVFLSVEGELFISVAVIEDADPYLVAVDLLLAAANIPGLPASSRVRQLGEAELLAQLGTMERENNSGDLDK